MKTILKNNITALFLSGVFLFSTITHASTESSRQEKEFIKEGFSTFKNFVKSTTSCSTSFVRTGCDSSYKNNTGFTSSRSLIKIEPKQKFVVDVNFHDDSAKNAWAEYEIYVPYYSDESANKTLTGIIKVTKDSKTSYVNTLPYAVYAVATVYNNLGSGITITATPK